MTAIKQGRVRRPNMRRAVVLFPSGLTLFNLFFGIFAIITASRGDFYRAGVYVLLGGICDALDGRVARATNAGSQFGEELDSLVDAISFGLAPAMIMYFAVLNRDDWQWVFVFLFAACAVMRLARFNIEQAGTAKTYFSGLPSPAAGCTLASYYWFSQSWLYNYGAIGNLPWQQLLRFLMAALAALMISPIPYPVFPRTGWRSKRALAGTLLLVTSATLFATNRLEYFFPLCLLYVAWGPIRWLIGGLFERRQPTIPYDLSEGEDDDEDEDEFEISPAPVHTSRHGAREIRPTREERAKKLRGRDDAAASLRPPRTEERPVRTERAERPERSEAERAARRDKRDKREKKEGRPERVPRPPRNEVVASEGDAPLIAASELPIDAPTKSEVVGSISTGGDGTVAVASSEATPARKRKRRRRRGERKERGPLDGSAPAAIDTGGDEGGTDDDGAFDDGPEETESRSPYALPPALPVSQVSTQAPGEAPSAPPPVAVSAPVPPAPIPSTEPHE
ncbi:MAG: CDP-diacylglycerol--serine O-phosphatidyltransferase [bacterium]